LFAFILHLKTFLWFHQRKKGVYGVEIGLNEIGVLGGYLTNNKR